MNTQSQTSRHKTAVKFWLSQTEICLLSDALSGQAKVIFQIMVATGQRFRSVKRIRWKGFNASLCTLDFKGYNCRIPVATGAALSHMRETALSEDNPIFTMDYKKVWDKVSRAYFALDIDQSAGCLKLAKWTYARMHFETYQNKTRLAKAMGITSARHIPKAVFQVKGPPACLVQF